MKANLIQRITLGVGAVISLAGISGCTEEEARLGRVIGVFGQVTPNATQLERAVGAVVDTVSKDTLDTINSKKMGTNVNVNVGSTGGSFISNGESQKLEYLAVIEDLETHEIITDKPIPRDEVDSYIVRRGNYAGKKYEIRVYRNGNYYTTYGLELMDLKPKEVIEATNVYVPKK